MSQQNDVKIFMEACGQTVERTPTLSAESLAQRALYKKLITEEYLEFVEAYDDNDMVEMADACGDLVWVILGFCNTAGINFNAVWQEVLASNMSKTVEGKVIKRADGKILKPDTFFPPNIRKALGLGAEPTDA